MAANVRPIFELTPVNGGAVFLPADTTTKKTLFTAGSFGAQIDAILVSSNDTAAVNLAFYILDTAGTPVYHYIGNAVIPIGSGYTSVVKVDAMVALKPANLNYIRLAPGYSLACNCVAAITTAKQVDVVAVGGQFS